MSDKNSKKDKTDSGHKKVVEVEHKRSTQDFRKRKTGNKDAIADTLPPPDHKPKK